MILNNKTKTKFKVVQSDKTQQNPEHLSILYHEPSEQLFLFIHDKEDQSNYDDGNAMLVLLNAEESTCLNYWEFIRDELLKAKLADYDFTQWRKIFREFDFSIDILDKK
jgi:hypothetical protein